ncbi:MAG TPA: DUF2752 domain-containing protein [Clostridiaceae bacterium]
MEFKILGNKISLAISRRLVFIFTIILIIAILAATYLYYHSPFQKNIYPSCIFRAFTGMYCPGCGATRATYALIHGNILLALKYNLFYMLCIPFILYLLISLLDIKINGKSIYKVNFYEREAYIVMGVILGFWILRNVPYFPFNLLAP